MSSNYTPPHLRNQVVKLQTLASGITLAPVKLSELVASPVKAAISAYVPPYMRNATDLPPKPIPNSIEITDSEFPSLALPTKGNSTKAPTSAPAKINFKKAVNDRLEREKMDELERAKGSEENVFKLSNAQLEADGWCILPLKASSANSEWYDTPMESNLRDEIHRTTRFSEEMEGDVGRFFEAYMKTSGSEDFYKVVKKIKSKTPLNDACMRYRAKMRSVRGVEAV